MKRLGTAVAVLLVCACGPAEVRLGEAEGIPPVKGTATIELSTFTCGQPITAGEYTVTTKVVTQGCELSFDKDVEVVKAADYQRLPDLQGAANLVQRVELTIRTLSFKDGDSGAALDLDTRVTSAELSINGQVVADKAALTALPKTVSLQGEALNGVKSKVDARQPASVRAKVVAVLPDTPAPPAKLKVDYDAQPALIVGPGQVAFP